MKKNNIISFSLELGMEILVFIFNILVISSLLFIFKIPITKLNFITSFITTIMMSFIYCRKKKYNLFRVFLRIFSLMIVLFASIFLANKCFDLSWDGNSYHKAAVGELKNGWNPLYENIEDFNISKKNSNFIAGTHDIWTNHYAKGQWIYAASIYSVTDNIESGKSINILAVISLFLISLGFLLKYTNPLFAFLISIIASLNPITIVQLMCYYNDILIYNFIVIELVFIQMIILENKKIFYIGLFITLCILINIKFTGLVYSAIIMLIYYIITLISKKYRAKYFKKLTFLGIFSILIGVCLIGSSTYLKNYKYENNPFYPLMGENKVDIMTQNQPKIFSQMNRFEKIFYANFSYSVNLTSFQDENPVLKIPLTYTKNELTQFAVPDLRIGGFGVLFGGILILSSIINFLGLYFLYSKDRNTFNLIFLTILSIIIFIFILEEAWWARYLPQLYLFPIISLYILYYFKQVKINKIISLFLVYLLLFNSYLIIENNIIPNIERYKKINNELVQISTCKNCEIYTTDFNGAMFNIYDVNKQIKVLKKYKNNYSTVLYNDMIYVYKE